VYFYLLALNSYSLTVCVRLVCLCFKENKTHFFVHNSTFIIKFQFLPITGIDRHYIYHILKNISVVQWTCQDVLNEYLIMDGNSAKICSANWNIIIQVELRTMNCILFTFLFKILNGIYIPKCVLHFTFLLGLLNLNR